MAEQQQAHCHGCDHDAPCRKVAVRTEAGWEMAVWYCDDCTDIATVMVLDRPLYGVAVFRAIVVEI